MATDRPRYTVSVDNDLFQQIEDFRFERRFQTRSEATVELIRLGLEALKKDPPDLLLTAWEEERALPMSRAIADFAAHHGRPGRVAVVIGPEGGIAAEEWEALRALGAVSVTLGPRILRTETAGLCALSVLWAALGEM